jgi:hypothetical protein
MVMPKIIQILQKIHHVILSFFTDLGVPLDYFYNGGEDNILEN